MAFESPRGYDELSNFDDTPRQRRDRVVVACDFCILRKIKCDAGQPCNQCSKRNRPQCTYSKERKTKSSGSSSGQRKTPKGTVQALEAKIRALESMVAVTRSDGGNTPGSTVSNSMGLAGDGFDPNMALESSSAVYAPPFPGNGLPTMVLPDAGGVGMFGTIGHPADETGFWLPPGSSNGAQLMNLDPNLGMRLLNLSNPAVDRPLSFLDPTDLPDSNIMNTLFRVYRETLGNLLLYSPTALRYQDASPLLRLSMSALAARYLPECAYLGDALFQRVRKLLQPTMAGDVPPTIDVIQATNNVVIYAGISNSEDELLWSHRALRSLTSFVKELGLDDERKSVVTRNWTGERVQESDLNLRRSLFWTIFCGEQHFVLMDTFRGAFRDADVNVGLPWNDQSEWQHASQPPIRLSQFENGLGELAYSPFARTIFLHQIMRRMVDVGMEAHEWQLKTGDFIMPPEIDGRRLWVRERLAEFYMAEVAFASQDAHQFGDVLVPQVHQGDDELELDGIGMFTAPLMDSNGHALRKSKGTRIFLTRLQAQRSLASKAIIYHGLSAFVGCPRDDLESFFDITNVGYLPLSKVERQRAKQRLTRWVNLPAIHAAEQSLPGAVPNPLQERAVENVLRCYEHVQGVVTSMQELLQANPSISFVHPLTIWCIWVCGVLDLARFVLSESLPDPDRDARIAFLLQVLKHVTIDHSWPFTNSFISGFERMYEWALRFKATHIVAALTRRDVGDQALVDGGLRFFPAGESPDEAGSRAGSSRKGSVSASGEFGEGVNAFSGAVVTDLDYADLELVLNS